MRELHVGDVVVVEEREGGKHLVGILTDRGIVVELVAAGIARGAVTIGDVMSFELATAREGDNRADAGEGGTPNSRGRCARRPGGDSGDRRSA
jgi:CBS domain-containing protein